MQMKTPTLITVLLAVGQIMVMVGKKTFRQDFNPGIFSPGR